MDIVSTKLMGGLGNLMFQISAAYGISLRDNKKLICDTKDMTIPHKPYSFYTNNIFRKIVFSDNIPNVTHIGESGFHYSPIPKLSGNIKLVGHFQSEKYFSECKHEVLELFEIDDTTKSFLIEKYKNIIWGDTCSIHVRRGDYLGLTNYHPVQPIDYYKNAIKIIGEDKLFIIFSDDVKWCEENFGFIENKFFVSGNTDYQDLYLMTMCKNNIISNSTFSWWSSWLNNDKEKIVVAPKKWFGNAYSNLITDDIYCNNWIKL